MKLISVDPSCGHTTVIIEKASVQYCVMVSAFTGGMFKDEVYENATFRKIRNDSKRYSELMIFAKAAIASAN